MDRRSFLKGTFGGVVTGGVIIAATDADIATFASTTPSGESVDVSPLIQPSAWAQISDYVYNERGHIIGLVKQIDLNREIIDTTARHDVYLMLLGGKACVTYTVQAIGFAIPHPPYIPDGR